MATVIWAVIIFCLIIFVHELGHFVTAKLAGIKVHEFSIGMGKTLFTKQKGETRYSIRLLPIGGYVSMEGEDGHSDDPRAFGNKSALKRFVVLASGAFMNFFLGFLLTVAIIASSATYIPTKVVDTVVEGSAFYDAGIRTGDKIVKLESEKESMRILCYDDISFFGYITAYEPCRVYVIRDGEKLEFDVKPKFNEEENRYLYGFRPKTENKGFFNTLGYSFQQSVFTGRTVIKSFAMLFGGKLDGGDVSGPVGIVKEIDRAAKSGILYVMNLASIISINLGVVNLLPIPALDGGRILFLIIEKIRRKPIEPEKEGMVHAIGFALLMLFMILVTFSDIKKLF